MYCYILLKKNHLNNTILHFFVIYNPVTSKSGSDELQHFYMVAEGNLESTLLSVFTRIKLYILQILK